MNAQVIMRTPGAAATNEEPELAFEESIPLDGNDPVGENMIEELGRGKESPESSADPARGA